MIPASTPFSMSLALHAHRLECEGLLIVGYEGWKFTDSRGDILARVRGAVLRNVQRIESVLGAENLLN